MSTILFSNENIFDHPLNEKTTLTQRKVILEHQLRQSGSIEAALELTSLTEHHHHMNEVINKGLECENHCDIVAAYYLCATRFVRQQDPIQCNANLLQLVKQSAELIKTHVNISKTTHLAWVPLLVGELREIGKQVKDEGGESDRLISLAVPTTISEEAEESEEVTISSPTAVSPTTTTALLNQQQGLTLMGEEYRRAIRITIYYYRAAFCEQTDLDKSIAYYRKCVSVRPTQLEPQQSLQESAKATLHDLIADNHQHQQPVRPRLPSRSSSVSSASSSNCAVACANCGVEKRGMPVCSKCKSQYYCGVRCLKAHKPVHELECGHH